MNENQTSWLADGVTAIEKLTKQAVSVEPKLIDLKHEKPGTYAIVMPGEPGATIKDRLEVRVAGPVWHNERLKTPQQLVAFIESLRDRDVAPEAGVVYISEESVAYHYSFEDRRDRAVCPLVTSQPWNWLKQSTSPLSQRELIRVLRITFDGCLPAGGDLINLIRNLKFDNQGTLVSNIQHGNESMGKQILNQVAGRDVLPEQFAVQLRVFENFSYAVNTRVALEVLPDVGRFEVMAFPNQLETAMQDTLSTIRELFSDVGVPAFIGASRPERDS